MNAKVWASTHQSDYAPGFSHFQGNRVERIDNSVLGQNFYIS